MGSEKLGYLPGARGRGLPAASGSRSRRYAVRRELARVALARAGSGDESGRWAAVLESWTTASKTAAAVNTATASKPES